MRIDPPTRIKTENESKRNEIRIQKTTRKIAIAVSFLIVYFFFIKLLFL